MPAGTCVFRAGAKGELAPAEGFLPGERDLDRSGSLTLAGEFNFAEANYFIVG